MKYKLVACGGTFDHFHSGHKGFLKFVLSQSEKVLLGITTDRYIVEKKLTNDIETFTTRKKAVEDFLRVNNWLNRIEIVGIDSIYSEEKFQSLPIEALIVTSQTRSGAMLINKMQQEKSRMVLPIIEYAMLDAEDGKPISSSRIRNGEINRGGKVYLLDETLQKTFHITDSLRVFLKEPFGILIEDFNSWIKNHPLKKEKIITVGDIITDTLHKLGFNQVISVIDLKVARKQRFHSIDDHSFQTSIKIERVVNPAGSITSDLLNKIWQLFQKKELPIALIIDGEEDLAVLPLILAAPLGFNIFYGQPEKGVVHVLVNELIKEKARSILTQFKAEI